MNIEEFNKLEHKVKNMVNKLKTLHDENEKLKSQISMLKKESSLNSEERQQIEKKVTTLIELIESIEK